MERIELQEGEEVRYTEQDVISALNEGNPAVLDAWYRQRFADADRTLDGRLGLEQQKAELLHAAGKDADAIEVLRDAIALAGDAGAAELKTLMEKRFLQLGGTPATSQERELRVLRSRNNQIQRELIAIGKATLPEKLTPEQKAHIAELRRELQDLIDREAALR